MIETHDNYEESLPDSIRLDELVDWRTGHLLSSGLSTLNYRLKQSMRSKGTGALVEAIRER